MRILMTMFGWADSGGGTILPRQLARALRQRGHDVLVVYAAATPLPEAGPYAVREHREDGVALVAVHNRPVPFLDDREPARELHDPEVVRIVAGLVATFRPDVVHYHNFLGLSLGVAEAVHRAGVPSCYTPYNFWLVCPTLYLTLPDLAVCGGVDEQGANCLRCTRAEQPGSAFVARRDRLRETIGACVGPILATSVCVRDVLLANGHRADQVSLIRLGNERADRIWRELGERRAPGVAGSLRIGFVGALLPIKGAHVLVAAAQRLHGAFEVHVHGDGPPEYLAALRKLDRAGVVRFHGRFGDDAHTGVLAAIDVGVVPSVCLDHSPLVVGEWQAARVPVVGARIGGIPDYLQAGAGALVPPGDPDSLAAVLQALIDTPANVAGWQRQLRAPASFAQHVDALEAIYRDLVAGGRDAVAAATGAATAAVQPTGAVGATAANTRGVDATNAMTNATTTTTPSAAIGGGAGALPRKLNLGCGDHHLAGWLNVDKYAAARPDLVLDLEQLPWPLPDDAADEVLLRHVLEHVGRDSDTFLGIVRELYRVCAPGAVVRVQVPHPRHQDFLQDPTHVRAITPETFLHFSLAVNREWQAKGLPGTPLAKYLEVDFAIVSVSMQLDAHWQRWLDADPARRAELDHAVRTHNNVVQECTIVLRAEKPFGGARGR